MPIVTQKTPGPVKIIFTAQVFKEGRLYVAYAPQLDVSSAGRTVAESKKHLVEAVEAFLEEAQRLGSLVAILEESGYERTAQGWKAPTLLTQESTSVDLPT